MALDRSEQYPVDLDAVDDDGAQEFWAAVARDNDGRIDSVSPGEGESLVDEGDLEVGKVWLSSPLDQPPVTGARRPAAVDRGDAAWGRERRDERDLENLERPTPPIPRRPTRRTARRFPTRLLELPPTRARDAAHGRGVTLQGGAAVGGLLAALGIVLLVVLAPLRSSPPRDMVAPSSRGAGVTRALDGDGGGGLPARAARKRTTEKTRTRRRSQGRTARLSLSPPRPRAQPASDWVPADAPAPAPSIPCCASSPPSSQGGGGRDDGGREEDRGGGRGGNGDQEFGFER